MPPAHGWSYERMELARSLFEQGMSASTAANILGGVTRNAVIGKWHRMGLVRYFRPKRPKREIIVRRAERQREKLRAMKRRVVLPPISVTPLPPPDVTDVARIALLDLEPHHCRWPVGEPTQGFCGCTPFPGLIYCESHARRAYRPAEPRRPSPAVRSKIPAYGINAIRNVEELVDG